MFEMEGACMPYSKPLFIVGEPNFISKAEAAAA
jgi:hypothetical protein